MKIANSLCVYLVWAKVDGAVDALDVGAPVEVRFSQHTF